MPRYRPKFDGHGHRPGVRHRIQGNDAGLGRGSEVEQKAGTADRDVVQPYSIMMGLRVGSPARLGAGLVEKVEMIGEREINVILLLEMSRAERVRRAKKTNNFRCPAVRRRRPGPPDEARAAPP